MLVFLFLTGFISLGYEMLWVRILSTYGLSTSQAFALILAGFLLGFSVGAWIVARKVDRRRDLEAWFSVVSIVTAALVIAVALLLGRVLIAMLAAFFLIQNLNSPGIAYD